MKPKMLIVAACLLTGCQAAHFEPNPTPLQPPIAATPAPAPLAFMPIAGSAMAGVGQPVVDGKITVVSAISGRVFDLQGADVTDAKGRFGITVVGLAKSDVANITVDNGKVKVSSLVAGQGTPLGSG